jgi:hypothetical protein
LVSHSLNTFNINASVNWSQGGKSEKIRNSGKLFFAGLLRLGVRIGDPGAQEQNGDARKDHAEASREIPETGGDEAGACGAEKVGPVFAEEAL